MSARILPSAVSVAKPQGSVRFPFTWQAAHQRCFTNALVRKPSNFMSDAISSSATTQLNLDTLVTQHEEYCDALTAAGMRLLWAQSIDEPDSVFVEDTAVASGGIAAICIAQPKSRRSEALSVVPVLLSCSQKVFMPVWKDGAPTAQLIAGEPQSSTTQQQLDDAAANNILVDGGDVLQVGGEMFMGLSQRSTPAGALYLAAAFAGSGTVNQVAALPVADLHRQQGSLHLKSLVTCVGADTVAVPDSEIGQQLLDILLQFSNKYTAWESVVPDSTLQHSQQAPRGGVSLSVVPVPPSEWSASNAVLANGTLIVRSKDECPLAFVRYEQYVATAGASRGVHQLLAVPAGQVELVDGALTCSSILLDDGHCEERS